MDLIDRQIAIDALDDAEDAFGYLTRDWEEVLIGLPPAQPQRIRGHWIPVGGALYQCDQCGAVSLERKFCSDCGAEMEVTE